MVWVAVGTFLAEMGGTRQKSDTKHQNKILHSEKHGQNLGQVDGDDW